MPLVNKTVLITRARKQAGELAQRLESLGAHVIEFPVIEVVAPHNTGPLDQAIGELDQYQWILFTSGNGVTFFHQRMAELGKDFAQIKAKIGVVGPQTASKLKGYGLEPDLVAEDFKAEGLLAKLGEVLKGQEKILFPRSRLARPLLVEQLSNRGIEVAAVDAYETVMTNENALPIIRSLQNKEIDIITFTSSSTVKNFCEALGKKSLEELLSNVLIACIGPITADTCKSIGIPVDIEAAEHTVEGLVSAIVNRIV